MSTATFDIGLSGLKVAQYGLATTSHNISNVNTEGYSRQRITMETRPGQNFGFGFVGKGVNPQGVQRIADDFLVSQLRNAVGGEANAAVLGDLLEQIDNQLASGLLPASVQDLFDAMGDANDDPALIATREVLLERAQAMLDRLSDQERQMNDMSRMVNARIGTTVNEINALSEAIARVNADIARSASSAFNAQPNDLFDQRDQLLSELSELTAVQLQYRGDNMVNVVIGNGQLMVVGDQASTLGTAPNALDVSRTEVVYRSGSTTTQVTQAMSGGELGALLDFRDDVLDPARSAIGRLGISVAVSLNEQQVQGMDLNGQLGEDFFVLPEATFGGPATNTGVINVAFDTANVGALTTSDYRLTSDSVNLSLQRLSDGQVTTLSGAGPFNVDGLIIDITAAPAAGDEWLLQPTKFAPRGLALALTDPRTVALASPVQSTAGIGNVSDAVIGRASVLDRDNAALLTTVDLVFNDPPTTFQLNGAGALIPYSSGADIDLNGWRVQITGTPAAGDTFTVSSNVGGVGDNGNGLLMAGLAQASVMIGGTATFGEAYGELIGDIGSRSQQNRISRDALGALRESAQARREALSGVNLDEEAANLLRYQQAYQAAAQVISVASTTFEALIGAVRN
jgi:flagellar hook-associated protein 1 FlgK